MAILVGAILAVAVGVFASICLFRNEREFLGSLDGFDGKIDIERWPVQVVRMWPLDLAQICD